MEGEFAKLAGRYNNPKDRLRDILSKVEYEDNDGRSRAVYHEIMEVFFTRASLHTFRSFGEGPIPNDLVPVFVGQQGTGKSRFCRYLAMYERLFVDLGARNVALGTPDSIRLIGGRLIVELSEMSVYSKTEVSVVKSFISQTVDSFRQLFERGMTMVPRTANLMGTTNEAKFLKDMTGNRRFFPIRVKKIDHNWLYAHQELIEETWAFYWNQANKAPKDFWLELSVPAKEFFDQENQQAMEGGYIIDLIEKGFFEVEKDAYVRCMEKNKTSVKIQIFTMIQKVNSYGVSLPSDLSKKIRYVMFQYGYKDSTARTGGKVVHCLMLDADDEKLKERMKPVVAQPEF